MNDSRRGGRVAYVQLGTRRRRVGSYALEYDLLAARPRLVDPITFEYTQLGTRPTRVIVPVDQDGLSEHDLIVLFFILDGEDQANE